jgi:hypothetical protein
MCRILPWAEVAVLIFATSQGLLGQLCHCCHCCCIIQVVATAYRLCIVQSELRVAEVFRHKGASCCLVWMICGPAAAQGLTAKVRMHAVAAGGIVTFDAAFALMPVHHNLQGAKLPRHTCHKCLTGMTCPTNLVWLEATTSNRSARHEGNHPNTQLS